MKNFLLSLFLVLLIMSCTTQKETTKSIFEIVEFKEYFDNKGVIIPDTSKACLFYGGINYKKTITPTLEQIRKAESILIADLYNYRIKHLNRSDVYLNGDSATKAYIFNNLLKSLEEDKEVIREYYRQYTAVINENDEVLVQILLCKYKRWKTFETFIDTGNGDERYYFVNVTKGIIETN
jgi:hypothetical protein